MIRKSFLDGPEKMKNFITYLIVAACKECFKIFLSPHYSEKNSEIFCLVFVKIGQASPEFLGYQVSL